MGQSMLFNMAFLVKIPHKLNKRLKGTCRLKNKIRLSDISIAGVHKRVCGVYIIIKSESFHGLVAFNSTFN